jgi:hypothetical protein
MENGWILTQPSSGPADNQIRNVIDDDQETIADRMSDVGIEWTASDKSPGSRAIGLQLARERIHATKEGVEPGLYVMDHCRAFISLVPGLTRDKKKIDDVDTTQEDHVWDETRYRVLQSSVRAATKVKVVQPT